MGKRERSAGDKRSKKRQKKDAEKSKTKEQEANSTPTTETPASTQSARRKSRGSKPIFLKKKVDIDVSLLPGALKNPQSAVEDSIGRLLMKYSDGLGGILMSYENVRLNSDKSGGEGQGWVFNELPWIHYTSSCDALVFRPYVGCTVS